MLNSTERQAKTAVLAPIPITIGTIGAKNFLQTFLIFWFVLDQAKMNERKKESFRLN
ncbi:hypothetical protein SAMN06265375_101491 [Muriicola jejuensis]|nr:hypothetical protein SAMN06265375_101491 [Muriicola jejuensis]